MAFHLTFALFIALAVIILTTSFSSATYAVGHINHNSETVQKEDDALKEMRNSGGVRKHKSQRLIEDDFTSISISDVQLSADDMLSKKSSNLLSQWNIEDLSLRNVDHLPNYKVSAEDNDFVWVPVEIKTTEKLTRRLWSQAIRQAIRKWMMEAGLKSKRLPLLNLDITRNNIFSRATITRVDGARVWSFRIRLKLIRTPPKVSNKKTLKENSQNVRNLTDIFLKNDFYVTGSGNLSTEIKTEFSVIPYNKGRVQLRGKGNKMLKLKKLRSRSLDMARYISYCAAQRCATKVDVWSTESIKSVIVQKAVQKVKEQVGFKLVYNYQKTKYWKIKWNIWKVVFPFQSVYQSNKD